MYETSEEAAAAQTANMRRAHAERRQARLDAELQGLDPPKWKRGRRPIYDNVDDAAATRRVQNKHAKERYKARVLRALAALEQTVRARDACDSSDE